MAMGSLAMPGETPFVEGESGHVAAWRRGCAAWLAGVGGKGEGCGVYMRSAGWSGREWWLRDEKRNPELYALFSPVDARGNAKKGFAGLDGELRIAAGADDMSDFFNWLVAHRRLFTREDYTIGEIGRVWGEMCRVSGVEQGRLEWWNHSDERVLGYGKLQLTRREVNGFVRRFFRAVETGSLAVFISGCASGFLGRASGRR
jgi:hypothetical protein